MARTLHRPPRWGPCPDTQDKHHGVIVVGAGFAGLACAHQLALHGLAVCVIDRKQDLGERVHTTGILGQEGCDSPLLAGMPPALLRAVPYPDP